ncbi:MAG: ATP-grasp fold amidoligase family protein [Bacilli bacterium]|jgi:hypothetical protein
MKKHKINKRILIALSFLLPAKVRSRLAFKRNHGYEPDLNNPQTFCEKLLWRKFNEKNDLGSELFPHYSNKFDVKRIVHSLAPELYIAKVLWRGGKISQEIIESMPNQFIIKDTAGCGVFIVDDKAKIDIDALCLDMNRAAHLKYGVWGHEYWYSRTKNTLMIEEYLHDLHDSGGLIDYKFHCFHRADGGFIFFLQVDKGRFSIHRRNWYDSEFKKMPYRTTIFENFDDSLFDLISEKHLREMLEIAKKLSRPFSYARIDLYYTDMPVLGEITFGHGGGFEKMDQELDDLMGSCWDICLSNK